MKPLIQYLNVIEDPRDIRGKKYKLTDILIMTIYGILNGHTDFTNIALFLKLREDYFTNLLNLEYGTPSHDCLSDVFANINSNKFMEQFILWIKDVVKNNNSFINIDGKAIKSARDKINGGNTPYIVSAFLSEIGVSIGEVKVDDKSNEITAIPELLDLLDIEGATITIDALGTQETIINKIKEKKAHYVLKVKDNQKDLKDDIKTYFDMTLKDKHNKDEIIVYDTGFEKDHGRIEHREYFISYNTDIILNKEKWSSVNAVGMVRVYREENDNMSIEEHYYIMDTKINIDYFTRAVRSHWNIECALHWRLDMIFDEDHSRNRVGNSIENLSIIRKIVFNLARLDTSFDSKLSMKARLIHYQADFKKIENLFFQFSILFFRLTSTF